MSDVNQPISLATDRRAAAAAFYYVGDASSLGFSARSTYIDSLRGKFSEIFQNAYPGFSQKQRELLTDRIIKNIDVERKNLLFIAIASKIVYDLAKDNKVLTPEIFKASFAGVKKLIILPTKEKSTDSNKITLLKFKATLLRYINYVTPRLANQF